MFPLTPDQPFQKVLVPGGAFNSSRMIVISVEDQPFKGRE